MAPLEGLAPLAKEVGATGAAALVLAAGIAWKLPKILTVLRDMVLDCQNYKLKRLELEHRIRSDNESRKLAIKERKAQIQASPNGRQPK